MGAAHSPWSTFSIVPCFSMRSSSRPMASLMANGTWRGLKNFGVASGSTFRVARNGSTVPSPSSKSGACHFKSASKPSDCVDRTEAISLLLSLRYFSQFRPKSLGPFPATTTKAGLATWSSYCTRTCRFPMRRIGSSVYVFKRISD